MSLTDIQFGYATLNIDRHYAPNGFLKPSLAYITGRSKMRTGVSASEHGESWDRLQYHICFYEGYPYFIKMSQTM